MNGHTPLPWVIDNRSVSDAEPQANTGRRALGDVIAECPTAFSGNTIRAPRTANEPCPTKEALDERGLANAEFIVRACNAHEDLLGALREAQALVIAWSATWAEKNGLSVGTAHPTHAEIQGKVAAAIAKAEGKP